MNLAKHHAKVLRDKRKRPATWNLKFIEEGEKAREQGKTEADCPYLVGSDEADEWAFGFELPVNGRTGFN